MEISSCSWYVRSASLERVGNEGKYLGDIRLELMTEDMLIDNKRMGTIYKILEIPERERNSESNEGFK